MSARPLFAEHERVDMHGLLVACAIVRTRRRLLAAWSAFAPPGRGVAAADDETLTWVNVARARAHRASEVES